MREWEFQSSHEEPNAEVVTLALEKESDGVLWDITHLPSTVMGCVDFMQCHV